MSGTNTYLLYLSTLLSPLPLCFSNYPYNIDTAGFPTVSTIVEPYMEVRFASRFSSPPSCSHRPSPSHTLKWIFDPPPQSKDPNLTLWHPFSRASRKDGADQIKPNQAILQTSKFIFISSQFRLELGTHFAPIDRTTNTSSLHPHHITVYMTNTPFIPHLFVLFLLIFPSFHIHCFSFLSLLHKHNERQKGVKEGKKGLENEWAST